MLFICMSDIKNNLNTFIWANHLNYWDSSSIVIVYLFDKMKISFVSVNYSTSHWLFYWSKCKINTCWVNSSFSFDNKIYVTPRQIKFSFITPIQIKWSDNLFSLKLFANDWDKFPSNFSIFSHDFTNSFIKRMNFVSQNFWNCFCVTN